MGRKFEVGAGRQFLVWNLEQCEEVVLIDAWMKVLPRIPKTETWTLDFEYRMFERGDHISERHIDSVNRHLCRIGLDKVEFKETNPSDYIRHFDKNRAAKCRRDILDHLKSISPEERVNHVAMSKRTMSFLEPAHHTWEEYKAWKSKPLPMPRPRPVLHMPAAEPPPPAASLPAAVPPAPAAMPVEVAMKLLEAASDPELRNQLVRVVMSAYPQTAA